MRPRQVWVFYSGLFLLCASTMMYEIVLTRLLSTVCWYYLAFVSISVAMFGMTAGALLVQLNPRFFDGEKAPLRLAQATFAMAVSLPIALMVMLAVPIDVSVAAETIVSFLLFSTIISVPFFFSGVAVCLSLTKTHLASGRVYAADLAGAAAGCLASAGLLSVLDAPSAIFFVAAVLFLSAAAYAVYGGLEGQWLRRAALLGFVALLLGGLNSTTTHGIQPIWSKGKIDRRVNLLLEIWNPLSKVRATPPRMVMPEMRGPSPKTPPDLKREEILLDIDNDADTAIMRFNGNLADFDYLRYDVTSVGAELRSGGSAAIIGVGGGRDVLNCAVNRFHRIVGIEVNSAIVSLDTQRLKSFSGFDKIPGLELHNDEGRSYLSRSGEKFDLIQASLVDTWAASAAGAMSLVENSLYTVDGWRVFHDHLQPGGIITFSRWYGGPESNQTSRLFSVAWAMLLSEGVADPTRYLAMVGTDRVATLLVSNEPFSQRDLDRLREVATSMDFNLLYIPGSPPESQELREIVTARSLQALADLRNQGLTDISPVFDSSPYFFSSVPLSRIPRLILRGQGVGANLRALFFVFAFMLSAAILTALTILVPTWRRFRLDSQTRPRPGAIAYFVLLGLAFMMAEMGLMQQLSIFLGHPIYSLLVVLTGLILFGGVGSLVSDRLPLNRKSAVRMPAIMSATILVLYSFSVIPVIHHYVAGVLWERVLVSLILVAPCGFFLGFCFPVGLRWMRTLQQEQNLPWMWALNGAASTLGSFIAILVSMNASITACVLIGAALYALAALVVPVTSQKSLAPRQEQLSPLLWARG